MAANTDVPKPPHGVYKNPRLMHAGTTIVGSTVHLQTKDGTVWEGIFSTFSPEFTICLDLVVQIDPKLSSKDSLYTALKGGLQVKKKAFFDLKDIVRITAVDVDLNYATKETVKTGLATDADISGFDPNKLGEHRQLESWQDDDGDNDNTDTLLSLDEVAAGAGNKSDSQNNSRGWDAQEMFRYNERVHKVTTTYDEKLTEYTVPLPKHNNKDWRQKQEKAAAIAKEIEGNTKSQNRLAKEDEGDCEEEKFSAVLRPTPSAQVPTQSQNQINQNRPIQPNPKNYRSRLAKASKFDALKEFSNKLTLAPAPRQSSPQMPQSQQQQQQQQPKQVQHQPSPVSAQQSQQPPHHQQVRPQPSQQQQPQLKQPQPQPQQKHQPQHYHHLQQQQPQQQTQHHQPHSNAQTQQPPAQPQVTVTTASPTTTASTTTTTPAADTSTISERSDTSSVSSQAKDHQTELAKKSKLNPNAKEFVYKPRSPANNPGAQTNGANQTPNGAAAIDPANSSPMSQGPHAPYYQQVPIFPHGLSPHAQQHHAAQFMPNHPHPHFQNHIHYMSPVPPHFAQQMPQRYIRGNFHNYNHRGEHHNNVRPDYSQASMMAPTSTGQFVASPSGAPHPMNAYASPQQPMIYSGPPQSMYPVVQAGFPQHMPHVMPNPPPYDGSTVYMQSQNYVVNQ